MRARTVINGGKLMTEGDEKQADDAEARDGDVADALDDARDLLEFLGRADDGRLQSYFADTKIQFAGVVVKKTSPPCHEYSEFLNRLAEIRRLAKNAQGLPVEQRVSRCGPSLSDAAFLLWARDFLAGVAAPATANTIRLTNEFTTQRAISWRYRAWRFLRERCWARKKEVNLSKEPVTPGTDQSTEAATPPQTKKPEVHPTIIRAASRLAGRITCLHIKVIFWSLFTVCLSIYALSGHLIIKARDDMIAQMQNIGTKIYDMEAHQSGQNIVNPTLKDTVDATANGYSGKFFLCDNIGAVGNDPSHLNIYKQTPSFGSISNGVFALYGSYGDIEICKSRRRTLTQLFAIGEQLISWQRVVTNPWPFKALVHTDLEPPLAPFSVRWSVRRLFSIMGAVFGRSDEAFSEFSDNKLICANFTGQRNPYAKNDPKGALGPVEIDPQTQARCGVGLEEIAEYYGRIPDSILGCITLYILPVLYGYLGAAVATMRGLRNKVDAYLVNFTEVAVVRQNQILGVVAGAVIGLFSAYLQKGPMESIGPSALAFLAGYNVSGLFRLLDDISNRVFRGGDAAAK
jgi:hypothetical protein